MADHDTHDHTGIPGVGTGAPLGTNSYAPGSPAALVQTSSTMADADATNMKVTFTAPASTNVLVRLTGCVRLDASGSGAGARVLWGLRESSSDIAGGTYVMFADEAVGSNYLASTSVAYILTGISAGSHTYKWSIGGGGGSNSGGVYCSTATPAIMEVWALA